MKSINVYCDFGNPKYSCPDNCVDVNVDMQMSNYEDIHIANELQLLCIRLRVKNGFPAKVTVHFDGKSIPIDKNGRMLECPASKCDEFLSQLI